MWFLLFTTGSTRVWAEEDLPAKLQQLTNTAYQYYSSRQTDKYFETVKKVKDATEFSSYQETFYRACSYEAIYTFEFVDRQKSVALAHDMYHHAKETGSNIGMYFATFTLGSIRELSGNNDMAEKSSTCTVEKCPVSLPSDSQFDAQPSTPPFLR